MLVSSPPKDYLRRNSTRDPSMSPSYRLGHSTPPRAFSNSKPSYDSPSPLRQRSLFTNTFATMGAEDQDEQEDLFLQSPYKSPVHPHPTSTVHPHNPQPIHADDEEGSIFLASSTSFTPFFTTSTSQQPLRTPVKQPLRTPSCSTLAVKQTNSTTPSCSAESSTVTRVGVGTKRKSTAHPVSTPLRQHSLTPLRVTTPGRNERDSSGGVVFDRLAPLPAPKFMVHTPQTKAETDVHLRKQTATLTKLKISDLNDLAEDFAFDNDSGCELEDDDIDSLFSRKNVRANGGTLRGRLINRCEEEVVEAISPDGHVSKRRARSRPVSDELLNIGHKPPSATPSPKKPAIRSTSSRPAGNGTIAFPSISKTRGRTTSASSNSSEGGSPLPRRRLAPASAHAQRHLPTATRKPFNRLESISSATLFFGPPIPSPKSTAPSLRSRLNTALSTSSAGSTIAESESQRMSLHNRHSFAGSGTTNSVAWNTIQKRPSSPSPRSSPVARLSADTSTYDDDEDMFFAPLRPNSSFTFNLAENTPSPRAKKVDTNLPTKYKPRDSGIVVSDDDDVAMAAGSGQLSVMPRASTSVNSVSSDIDDGLVTPGVGPEPGSGWPVTKVFVSGTDDHEDDLGAEEGYVDVDAFIMRTLAAPAKGPQTGVKKVPGTPVKSRTLGLSARPWQSAVAHKVGLAYDWDKKTKAPRKSLPAAFPVLGGKKTEKACVDPASESEGEEDSPSGKRDKYTTLGLGRPPPPPKDNHPVQRTRWLMRRSSSGAFSSGSESLSVAGTPTRRKGKDWHLPMPRFSAATSPTKGLLRLSPVRSISGSSNSSVLTLHSPTNTKPRHLPIAEKYSRSGQLTMQYKSIYDRSDEENPGRFEREFVEVDEVGSGEFGKVLKVRCKFGDDKQVYAVKKSKRFEGPKHRLRLREEVDILQHLSQAAASCPERGRHPNVLAYIDSWEEDDALFIRTELCESGNLAGFLWEYGRVFPRLDEARVWKIFVDLSNGLRFIHEAGVIHLDLKPSNVFVTGEGRFKIGDFGMASLWPRPNKPGQSYGGFEREGDKLYLAPEVLQGKYGKAADIFSFGMTMLETATNVVVPDQGEAWHRLRREDFSQIDLDDSPELIELISRMMRTNPASRITIHDVCNHPIVSRARATMERTYLAAKRNGTSVFAASPLSSVPRGFLDEILARTTDSGAMDLSL